MDSELLIYFEKYLLEELDVEEVERFERRLKDDAGFAKAYQRYLQQLRGDTDLNSTDTYQPSQAWKKIDQHLFDHPKTVSIPNQGTSYLKWAASISMVFLLGAVVYWLVQTRASTGREMLTKTTAYGQKSTITLSDGTTVRLNSGSKLTYPKVFGDSSRLVMLEGEAFFDVTSDASRPFLIRSGKVTTRVLGTSFNIHAFPEDDEQEVAVKTGTVQVYINDGLSNTITLRPGKKARYNIQKKAWEVEEVNPEDIAYWARGYLYFDNEPLKEVFKELSRWYGVDIEVKNPEVLNCRITLKQRDENLKNILNIIKFATHVNYQFQTNKVIINGSPC